MFLRARSKNNACCPQYSLRKTRSYNKFADFFYFKPHIAKANLHAQVQTTGQNCKKRYFGTTKSSFYILSLTVNWGLITKYVNQAIKNVPCSSRIIRCHHPTYRDTLLHLVSLNLGLNHFFNVWLVLSLFMSLFHLKN